MKTIGHIFVSVVCLLILLTNDTSAQHHPMFVKQGESVTTDAVFGISEFIVDRPDHGSIRILDHGSSFSLEYTADSTYLGYDTVLVEYLENGSSPAILYERFIFDVQQSYIHCESDFFALDENASYQSFDILSNDTASDGPLQIHSILHTQHGLSYILDDSLYFKPSSYFTGIASVTYRVCDTLFHCKTATVQFIVVDENSIAVDDTLSLYTLENNPVRFLLPDSGFMLQSGPQKGIVNDLFQRQVFEYQPFQGKVGEDVITVQNSDSVRRVIHITIVERPYENQRVVDDYIFTTINQTVHFDVLANDLVHSGRVSDFSSPIQGVLQKGSGGSFTYIPDSNYSGLVTFTYETCVNGGSCEIGDVQIYVGNLNPDNRSNYELVTPKNRPLVINYDVPISNFMFDISQAASHGQLNIYPGYDTLYIGCEEVRGNNLVVYLPDSNFVGFDEFDLEYCVGNQCQIVKVKVDVVDIQLDSICICADDCVWPGDINYDGTVTMTDLLCLGYHIGAQGQSRPNASATQWYGQYSPNWPQIQSNYENVKHADVDGDGQVTVADTIGISNFYDNIHSLQVEPIPEERDYPIYLEIESPTNPQKGDYVVVSVKAGTSAYPISSLHGMALQFQFDPRIVDTSSLDLFFPAHSWLVRNEGFIDMIHHQGRSIAGGVSRIDGLGVPGMGEIAKVGFIVEDDIDGIRANEPYYHFDLQVKNGYAMGSQGDLIPLPDVSLPLRIAIADGLQDKSDIDITSFPNPTSDQLTFIMNRSEIYKIEVFDLTGRVVWDETLTPSSRHTIELAALQTGQYFARIHSTSGLQLIKTIQVVR